MGTAIRPEISTKNKYYIDKHRYYELKHFCLQYGEWKKAYLACTDSVIHTSTYSDTTGSCTTSDLTAKYAMKRVFYGNRLKLIERTAMEADEYLWHYILRAVTEGLSFTYLKTTLNIPCGKDMYYDRYRRFFWLLSQARN